MTTDVAERTETQAATEALQTGDTEALQSTDTTQEVQTEAGSEQTNTEGSSPPSGREQRLSALADAEREELLQQGREAALEELRQTGTKQQREAARQKLRAAFPTTIKSVEDLLNGAINEGRSLTTNEVAEVKRHFNNYNMVAETAAAESLADDIRDQIYSMLPRAAQEDFTKATVGTDDKPVDLATYFAAAVEHAAPHSKYMKSLDLDDVEKLSPKLKKQLAERDLRNHDEGYNEGLTAPPGTSPDGGRGAGRTAPGNKTYQQLEEAYGAGTSTKEEEKLYLKMRADRTRSR